MPDPFWTSEFSRRQGEQQAARAAEYSERPNFLAGFIGSTTSGLGELFGAEPTQTAIQFREDNPLSGFVSQMIGPVGAYSGMFRLSRTARGAAALDNAMTRLPGVRALSAADNPILYGASREMLRYSPLELSRLGIGFAIADDSQDYGDMLADVGLSTILTGGFGAVGGFFRAGGQRAADMGRIVGADLAFRPTFEFRMSRVPGAQVYGEVSLQDVQNRLIRDIFTERPFDAPIRGQRQRYVDELAGGTPESDALVNTLFRPSGDRGGQSLLRQPLMRQNGQWLLGEQETQRVLAGIGFQSMDDLAEAAVYPRLITVNSRRAAGTMARILDESPALQYVGDGVMLAREGNTGLYVVAKRLRAGAVDPMDEAVEAAMRVGRELDPATANATISRLGLMPSGATVRAGSTAGRGRRAAPQGSTRVAEGDQWLILKTDQPQRFVPRAHKVAQLNVEQWARYRDAFKPSNAEDIFNARTDAALGILSPRDFLDLKTTARQTWVSKVTEKAAKKFGQVSGLERSATYRNIAEQMAVAFKPAIYLENQNPIYQRLVGLLRLSMNTADELVNTIMGGKIKVTGRPYRLRNVQHGEGFNGHRSLQQLWREMDDAERQLVVRAAQTQTPADDLAKLSADGLISARAQAAVAELQAINKDVWDQVLLPAFNSAGLSAEFNLLEGYIMPRLFKGDWFVPVLDESGKTVWLASGGLKAAKEEAEQVIAAAREAGKNWTRGSESARHLSQTDSVDVERISQLVRTQIGQNSETQAIVQSAMKRIELARAANRKGGSMPGTPMTLKEERGGLAGTPDIHHYSLEDVMKASEDHYNQLLRFAAYHTWSKRWMETEAMNLSRISPTLYDDLRRKGNQYLGIEGKITKVLNQTLSPIFGHTLGGKAATRIAQGTNHLMYMWNLAIVNPTFALLNLMNPLQTVAPWISFMTKAPTEAAEKLMQVGLRYGTDGRPSGTFSHLHPMKVLGQSLREMREPGDDLLEAYGKAKTDGTLNPQLYEGWVGGTSRAHQTLRDAYHNAGGGISGGWEFIKRTSTFMAEKSEEFSRMMAFTSAHILGRDAFGLTGEALYRFSQRATHVTMYGYGVVDRSRIFTGPIGSMFGLFKNWQFHFIGSMAQYAGLGIKQGIWAPMIWQGAAALALGGLGATPLKLFADGLARWYTDSPNSYLWLQENWPDAADEIYFGLPALLGASLQASATTPGTDVRNDLANLTNFVFIERAKQAVTAVRGAYDLWNNGDINALQDSNTRDQLMQAFAPRAVFRLFSSTEGEYVKSMRTGYPQQRDVSASSRFLHALGLNTTEIESQQVAARELWNDQQRRRNMIQALGTRYAEAQLVGDRDEMQLVVNRALALGVPVSSVVQSAHTRFRRETQSDSLSRYDQDLAGRYIRALDR